MPRTGSQGSLAPYMAWLAHTYCSNCSYSSTKKTAFFCHWHPPRSSSLHRRALPHGDITQPAPVGDYVERDALAGACGKMRRKNGVQILFVGELG